jgi:hypothetical protein
MMADPAAARDLVARLETEQDGFCRLVKLAPSKKDGYIQLSVAGANKFAVLQEVLLWSKHEMAVEGLHISHLCDKPRCAVAEHVVLESPGVNNSRKNCGKIINCAHCEKKYIACDHEPKCISYVPGFASWADFMQEGLHD